MDHGNDLDFWEHRFPAHDEDVSILLDMIQTKHDLQSKSGFDFRITLLLERNSIVATCWSSADKDLQIAALAILQARFWQLVQLQCMEKEFL